MCKKELLPPSITRIIVVLLLCSLVTRSNASDNIIWGRIAGGPSHDDASEMAADSAGNVYFVGDFSAIATFGTNQLNALGATLPFRDAPENSYLAKVDKQGNWLWVKHIECDYIIQGGLAVTPEGEAYVAARFRGSLRFESESLKSDGSETDAFLAKLDRDGHLLWLRHLKGLGSADTDKLSLDPQGNVVFLGSFSETISVGDHLVTSHGEGDAIVAKFNAQGGVEWVSAVGGTSDDRGSALAVGPNGNIWILGTFADRITIGNTTLVATNQPFGNIKRGDFLTKLSPDGVPLWSRLFETRRGNEPEQEMTIDSDGNCYLVGNFGDSVTLGDQKLVATNDGFDDVFLSRINSDGNVVWARRFGGRFVDYADSILLSPLGHIVFAGAGGKPGNAASPPEAFVHFVERTSGELLSSIILPVSEVNSDISFLTLAQSPQGDLYAAGWLEGSVTVAGATLVSSGKRDALLIRVASDLMQPKSPQLNINRVGSKVRVSWSKFAADYHLERRSGFSGTSQWEPISETPIAEDALLFFDALPIETSVFYRLSKP